MFDGTLGSSFVINSDMLAFSLVAFVVNQLDIISFKLLQLKSPTENDWKDNTECLIKLIKHHQTIIKYIDTFNTGLKYVILFDFLQCSIQLATITLQLLVVSCFET